MAPSIASEHGLRIPLIVKPGSQSSRQQNAVAFYTDRVAQGIPGYLGTDRFNPRPPFRASFDWRSIV